jgi:hypothetical protein
MRRRALETMSRYEYEQRFRNATLRVADGTSATTATHRLHGEVTESDRQLADSEA